MSFKFDWSVFKQTDIPAQVKDRVNALLSNATSQTDEPVAVSGELEMMDFGTEEPDLKLIEVHELSNDEMRLSFAFAYYGNAAVSFGLRAQVNPLVSEKAIGSRGRQLLGCLAAHRPLRIPIRVVVSEFRLDGKLVLTYKKDSPFMTVQVRNECLQSVKVNSNFDGSGAGPQIAERVRDKLQGAMSKLTSTPIKVFVGGSAGAAAGAGHLAKAKP